MNNLFPFLLLTSFLSYSSCIHEKTKYETTDGTEAFFVEAAAPFYHGVASGDPGITSVLIWTRLTPQDSGEVHGTWTMSTSDQFEIPIQSGKFSTSQDSDYTVKVVVPDLLPDTRYYYRFRALGKTSVIGQTKTLPAVLDSDLVLAVVSCSNYEAGYYNAFRALANMDEVDAILHLGDYIYEYQPGRYGDTSLHRFHLPPKEIVHLSDYRTRYAQYRLDPDFALVHQKFPFICIWDDHEIANNSYSTGAQNHQAEEGDYQVRKNAAIQAYFEWIPVRSADSGRLYRAFDAGNLASIIMLDERMAGRTAHVSSIDDPSYQDSNRTMLGHAQMQWLAEEVEKPTLWKIIGNQVILSEVDFSMYGSSFVRNLDAWDGYPADKDRVMEILEGKENILVLSGDTHTSWAFEVPVDIESYRADSTDLRAVEIGTPSITSANHDESSRADRDPRLLEKAMLDKQYNPHMKYRNITEHGFVLLHITKEIVTADWYFVPTIKEKVDGIEKVHTVTIQSGSYELD